jgi:hypothetical protein
MRRMADAFMRGERREFINPPFSSYSLQCMHTLLLKLFYILVSTFSENRIAQKWV